MKTPLTLLEDRTHVSDERLLGFTTGETGLADALRTQLHLLRCPDCRARRQSCRALTEAFAPVAAPPRNDGWSRWADVQLGGPSVAVRFALMSLLAAIGAAAIFTGIHHSAVAANAATAAGAVRTHSCALAAPPPPLECPNEAEAARKAAMAAAAAARSPQTATTKAAPAPTAGAVSAEHCP